MNYIEQFMQDNGLEFAKDLLYRTQAEAEANIDKHIKQWRDAGVD